MQAERKRRGLTQEDLSDLTNLHRTYISEVERGKRNPALENISKIAKALGMKVHELTDGID